jgi:YgiT-type zinc finger domain-containing protein
MTEKYIYCPACSTLTEHERKGMKEWYGDDALVITVWVCNTCLNRKVVRE